MSEEQNEAAALAAAVQGFRMLADGTIAITIHVEPNDRAAALVLCSPGQPVGVIALKSGFAAKSSEPPRPRDTRGPLCKLACDLTESPVFREFAAYMSGKGEKVSTAEAAKQFILGYCGCKESRKELDEGGDKARAFKTLQEEFALWRREQRV